LSGWTFEAGFSMVVVVIVSLLSLYLSSRIVPYHNQKIALNMGSSSAVEVAVFFASFYLTLLFYIFSSIMSTQNSNSIFSAL